MSQQNNRGNRRGRVRQSFVSRPLGTSQESPPDVPFGSLLDSISKGDLSAAASSHRDETQIINCDAVASYNWLEKACPSIAVPGMPPKWTPLAKPLRLPKDSGPYYRDPNAASYPRYPIEPAVEAVMANLPSDPARIDKPIDIFGCASTLGNLLRFAHGECQSFRMLVQVIGKTIHLIRREKSPTEIIPDVRGYGHTFPEAYTTWDEAVKGSRSHQRIISYGFGGLRCLVRFEADGYLPDLAGDLKNIKPSELAHEKSGNELRDALADAITSTMAIHSSLPSSTEGVLEISRAGAMVPQRALFDLKTRSVRRQADEDDILAGELPRLWLRQLRNFVLAFNAMGTFTDVRVRDIQEKVDKWEVDNADGLARFAALLHEVVSAARESPDGRLEIVYDKDRDFLQIREQHASAPLALSKDVENKWKKWLDSSSDEHQDRTTAGVNLEKDTDRDGSDIDHDSFSENYFDGGNSEASEKDYTACDIECGYCGHCMY